MRRLRLALFVATAAALATAACIRNPATRKVHARLLSPETERKIGEETKKQILQEYKVFPSTPVAAYVNKVGQKLAAVCDRPTVDYDFTVLDSDIVNAFAVPGGFIFVTRGLLDTINDEAELAMVLGHEIAHVTALHGVQMIQKELGQNALTILGTIGAALTAGPEALIMMANTANLFSSLYLLGYSRDKELEADNLGIQYVLRAGYDPRASLSFFQKLDRDEKEARGWDLYFRTHPNTKERIRIIESMIGRGDRDAATSHREEYQKIKALIPRVGDLERGVIDGTRYRNPIHGLTLSVPENWRFAFVHPQALVSFATKDKDGEGRLQVVELASTTKTAVDLAVQFARDEQYRLMQGREVLYPAGYGFLGRFMGVMPSGKLLEIRLFCTIRRGVGYVMLCGAPPEKADSYSLDLERILRAFKFDTGMSAAEAAPRRK